MTSLLIQVLLCQASDEWRIVSQYLKEIAEEKGVTLSDVKTHPLLFDPNKHKILISELKMLYTAVTRARAKVWFFEEDEEAHRPVFEYFKLLGLAEEMIDMDTELREGKQIFAKKSTVADWDQQGSFFYNKRKWNVASKCFSNARNQNMASKCKAYMMADHAQRLHTQPRQRKEEFLRAADQFLQADMIQQAKVCLHNAQEHRLYDSLLERLGKVLLHIMHIITVFAPPVSLPSIMMGRKKTRRERERERGGGGGREGERERGREGERERQTETEVHSRKSL